MIDQILQRYGFEPDKLKGQHFLDSEDILDTEVEEADLEGSETVLEVGGGIGNLTRKIAGEAGDVHTVEKDPRLVEVLEEELSDFDNVHIHNKDILDMELPDFDKCISNPPYQISGKIVELLGTREKISILTFQDKFAERLVAAPGSSEYSRISVIAQFSFLPVFLQEVPAESFVPPPEVDSAVVKMYPRNKNFEATSREGFKRTVRGLFTNRRKKARNAFVDSRHILEISKERAKKLRDKIPFSEERVIDLEVKELVEISNYLEEEIYGR